MKAKHLIWNGNFFLISIRRDWQVFWGFVPFCESRNGRIQIRLPTAMADDLLCLYSMTQRAKGLFANHDYWWEFSRLACDQYCWHYAVGRSEPNNIFLNRRSYFSDQNALFALARTCKGFSGPDDFAAAQLLVAS